MFPGARRYASDRELRTELFERLGQRGYTITENGHGGHNLARRRGKVMLGGGVQLGDRVAYLVTPELSLSWSANQECARQVGEIFCELGAEEIDVLEGMLPARQLKILRLSGCIIAITPMLGGCIALASYLFHGSKEHILERTPGGRILAVILGLTWLAAFIALIVLTHRMEKNQETDR